MWGHGAAKEFRRHGITRSVTFGKGIHVPEIPFRDLTPLGPKTKHRFSGEGLSE